MRTKFSTVLKSNKTRSSPVCGVLFDSVKEIGLWSFYYNRNSKDHLAEFCTHGQICNVVSVFTTVIRAIG